MKKTVIIGVAGGSASGKTSVAKTLMEYFDDTKTVTIIRQDDYYKDQSHMPFQEGLKTNDDHPDAFDTDLLCEQLKQLKEWHAIEMPVYDYSQHNRSDQVIVVHPAPVLILEGILIFAEEELCRLMDIKVFVDTDADVRILRRILRDVKARGRSLDSVITQYLTTVKPMHEQFVEPSKRRADVIIPDGGYNMVALEMLIQRVRSQLDRYRSENTSTL
jgi:uridine kinase